MQSIMKYVIPAVLILAVIGLVLNPFDFLRQIVTIAVIAGIIFLIYRLYMSRKYGIPFLPSQSGPSRAQIRKAKRTSTQKVTQPPSKFRPRTSSGNSKSKKKSEPLLKKRREDHQLTVIEGKKNKSKKKNRALF
ncbi:hypothetical protein [Bacillus suaedae]|uniref:YqhP n=1 Tax=Halalkalibacter suaedae TaxID=2822140 RepID=A0A940WX90_9BACI|nr:hypothetical protein [Bacillus suaedae]MBP3952322.1 hypothetical protein [Bacillus suaedae]